MFRIKDKQQSSDTDHLFILLFIYYLFNLSPCDFLSSGPWVLQRFSHRHKLTSSCLFTGWKWPSFSEKTVKSNAVSLRHGVSVLFVPNMAAEMSGRFKHEDDGVQSQWASVWGVWRWSAVVAYKQFFSEFFPQTPFTNAVAAAVLPASLFSVFLLSTRWRRRLRKLKRDSRLKLFLVLALAAALMFMLLLAAFTAGELSRSPSAPSARSPGKKKRQLRDVWVTKGALIIL